MTFDQRLRSLRQLRGDTLSTLAAKTRRLSPSQISRYERGLRPTVDAIADLAQALDVPVEELAEPVFEKLAEPSMARAQ